MIQRNNTFEPAFKERTTEIRESTDSSEIYGIFQTALKIGYGAGEADTKSPNVLRMTLLEKNIDSEKSEEAGTSFSRVRDFIEILETNLDDVTGEVLGNLTEKLFEAGARDVSILPILMKKGRPGHMVRIISKKEDSVRLAQIVIRETGSLGVRVIPTTHRIKAFREIEKIEIRINKKTYTVPVKMAYSDTKEIVNVSAEYEACKKIAEYENMPVREIIQYAEQTAKRKKKAFFQY